MSELAANVAIGCGVALSGVALLLCMVGVVSYRRIKHPRLMWVAVALGVLTVQGIVLTRDAWAHRAAIAAGTLDFPLALPLGLGIAAALYLSVIR